MTKWVGARQVILAAILPGAALVLAGVSEADFIFHVANYMYLHEEELFIHNYLSSGDFDGDDHADFVLGARTSTTEGYLEVFLGNGDGTFQALDHVATKEIWAWAVGDFDNDGLDDVLVKDFDGYMPGDTAQCYLSVGDGQFAEPIGVPGFLMLIGGGVLPNHTDVADYDSDGNRDIALAAFDSVEVYLGAGDGIFARSWGLTSSSTGCISVESGDVDNDGILDLILVGHQSFGIFPGLGDGTFGTCTTGGGYSGPGMGDGDACCGDFDEDGWNDVAVTAGEGIGSWTLFVFLNQGDGTFSVNPDYCYIDGYSFFDIFCEDLNLDGHLDLGASLGWTDDAVFLRGFGDGSFDATQTLWFVIGFGGLETARGDFDEDGDTDVAVTRYDGSTEYPSGIYVIPNETIQEGIEGEESVPGMLSLHPSANPFSSSVTITCEGEALPGQLMVYDLTGRLIRSLSDRQGSSFLWDGHDGSGEEVPMGTFLIQGAVDGQVSSLRVVRL